MSRWRRSKIAVATVLFLLSFTALDLIGDTVAYPFCAGDLEESTHSVGAVEVGEKEESDSPIPADVHIDDCFCCSRCVTYSVSFAFYPRTQRTWIDSAPPVSFTLLLPHELYRPPRLS